MAKGQLDEQQEAAIFAAPIGGTSDVVVVADDGTYLFKVLAEETRTPEGRQLEQIRSTAPSPTGTSSRRTPVTITRDEAITNAVG